jgi:hypothetical protein
VAIAAGHAFVFASAYYFAVGTLGERMRRGFLAFASLLLGLAIGSRFPLIAAGIIPTVLAAHVILRRWREPMRDHVTTVLAFFGPLAACLFLLGLYNYLRFESWTQFGLVYTLQDWRSARTYQFIDIAHVPPGLYYYLLVPPRLSPAFPFIFLDPAYSLMPPEDYWVESIGGILPVVPLVSILLFAPAFIAAFRRVKPALCIAIVTPLVVGGLMFGLYAFWAAIMRYETDFGTFFLIPSLLLWFAVINSLRASDWRRATVLATFATLLLATVTINGAISLTGYYDNLRAGSPAQYEAIHNVFRPLERFFSTL